MNTVRLIPLAALAALFAAGCSSQSVDTTAEAIASPITAPVNAAVNNTMPLPQNAQYTYWRRLPDTNLYEPYTSDHPLTKTEQENLGIVPPGPAAKAETKQ